MRFPPNRCDILACAVAMALIAGCGPSRTAMPAPDAAENSTRPVLAAASPYLAAVATELLDDVTIVPLASPGACPGHFDLRPSQIEQLASAAVLLRFDFQAELDGKLAGRLGDRLAVVPVSVPGGLCDPHAYEAVCRQVADRLVERHMLAPDEAKARLTHIAARMRRLLAGIKRQVDDAGLSGTPVVAGQHQADFCRLLGLDVVATLTSADTARPSTLDDAVAAGQRAGVKWIIANRPEGRRLADVVADRLDATVLVFDNFPESDQREAFDRLVRANVRTLVEGARP
jgi:zinc transport system substrate-binding protein